MFLTTRSRALAMTALGAAAPALALAGATSTLGMIAPTLFALAVLALVAALHGAPIPVPLRGVALRLCFLAAAVGILLWPAFALAQANPGTELNLGGLFGDVRGTIETVAGVVVAAILGLISFLVKKNLGLSIDGKMRDTLQSAAVNGVHLGLDGVQALADKTSVDVKSKIVADAIGYVRTYAPAAIKHFGLGEADLAAIVKAKLAALQPAEASAVARVPGA